MVASEDYKVTYATDGTTGPFAITFPARLNSASAALDIKVYYRSSAGDETDITSLCTITGVNVYTVTAYAAGAQIVIFREPEMKQESGYKHGTKFPATQFEDDFDYAMYCIHRVKFAADRAIKGPVTDAATIDMTLPSKESRASNYLGFNSDGEPIAIAGAAGDVTVSAFMETVLDDATAEEAKMTLEIDDRKIGQIVGGGLRYVSSDLVKLRPINYHFQTAAGVDAWVRVAAETSFTGATTNYPSAGSWAYVLGDVSGNITLAAAAGAATERPSDAYFQWGELGGTGFSHEKNGYYSDATHRILGAIHKISSTSFYFISMQNGSDEVGRNSLGKWNRVEKMQICSKLGITIAVTTLANQNIGTYGWSYYAGSVSQNHAVPFIEDPSASASGTLISCISIANTTTITIYGTAAASATITDACYTAVGFWRN